MTTISDVAQRCGLSKTTVSFVLNNAPMARQIPEDTKVHIRRVATELGYHPNQFARFLRNKRSNTIGVVVFDIADPYCTQILRGVEDALYKSGAYLMLLSDAQNNRVRFERYVKMLLERQVEGLIALGNSVYPEDTLLAVLRECRLRPHRWSAPRCRPDKPRGCDVSWPRFPSDRTPLEGTVDPSPMA